jgi:MFS family permease
VVTAYLLTATAVAPLCGKLSDMHGRRPVIFLALAIFVLGSIACALAPGMLSLVVARAIQGAGAGGMMTLAQTMIGDLVPPRERARYAAWFSGMWAVASLSGPILGGVFAEHFHWSLIFWINIPIVLLGLPVIWKPLKRLAVRGDRHRLDVVGAVLLVAATSLLMLTLTWGGTRYPCSGSSSRVICCAPTSRSSPWSCCATASFAASPSPCSSPRARSSA